MNVLADAVASRPGTRSDDEQIWLTRFLTVRATGYLEQVFHETFRGFIGEKCGGMARAFALSYIEKSRTPSPQNIKGLLGRIDVGIADSFDQFLEEDDQRRFRELSLLLDRRHKIAHGFNEGLNTQKAVELKMLVEEVADWLIETLNPSA